MISNKFIVDKASQIISGGGLTEAKIAQMYSVDTLSERSILSVANLAALPDVVANLGSLVYVVAENKYYFSDGEAWSINYSSAYSLSATAYSWGTNTYGQLGNGTGGSASISSPATLITPEGVVWASLTANRSNNSAKAFGIARTTTGVAYGWGSNNYGQLGNNSGGYGQSTFSPVSVVGGLTWASLSAGGSQSLGVTTAGVAYAWGRNHRGQLGDGTETSKSSPVSVVGGLTWSKVSTGYVNSVGITTTGVAYAWGSNYYGQLGNNNTVSTSSPVVVVGGITDWTDVQAGFFHVVGLTSTGVAYAWGAGNNGGLGDGTTTHRSSPVLVVGGLTWSQLSTGPSHTVGITTGGIAYAWGGNSSGQLGDGTTSNRSSPVSVIGGITNWSQVSTGFIHSLGVTGSGIAYAWGANAYGSAGALGDGTATNRSSPVTVVGGLSGWTNISAGTGFSLGLIVSETGIA